MSYKMSSYIGIDIRVGYKLGSFPIHKHSAFPGRFSYLSLQDLRMRKVIRAGNRDAMHQIVCKGASGGEALLSVHAESFPAKTKARFK